MKDRRGVDGERGGAIVPNLFIVGAMKSGTTSLHTYLAAHPDVYMSSTKEPGYFTPEEGYYPKDLDWYLSLFEAGAGHRVVGESSTHYTKRPVFDGVAERIRKFSTDARIVYVMRDPVRRAISHYWHARRRFEEHRSILEAIEEVDVYRQFGDYPYQLEPYLSTFGSGQVYTLTFETLTRDPRAATNDVLEWLSLGALPDAVDFSRENAMPEEMKGVRGQGRLQRLRSNPIWSKLSPLVPGPVKGIGKRMAQRPLEHTTEHEEAVSDLLRPWAEDVVQRTSALLGRDFHEWTSEVRGE